MNARLTFTIVIQMAKQHIVHLMRRQLSKIAAVTNM
jgi:hypothetical protein